MQHAAISGTEAALENQRCGGLQPKVAILCVTPGIVAMHGGAV